MSTSTQMAPIQVKLTKDQIADLVYQQLEDEVGDADKMHARHAIDFARSMRKLGRRW